MNTPERAITLISSANHFQSGNRDQVMIFASPNHPLPSHLGDLLIEAETLVTPHLDQDTRQMIFGQRLARQCILNLYPPGQGITPHVDLPHRYADGILGISMVGGTVMTFTRSHRDQEAFVPWTIRDKTSVPDWHGEPSGIAREERYDVYLPPRSIYILCGEARWDWKHGIEGRFEDVVQDEDGKGNTTMLRDLRVSVTFRWMLDGADVLG
jgi:hypothetical protein